MVALTGGALLLFFVLCATGLVLSSILRGRYAALLIAWFGTLCSILLMLAAVARLVGGQDFHLDLWTLNGWGALSLHVDALSAVFLFAAGLVYLSCCLFAPDYLLHYFRNRYPAGRYAVLHFALMASVALILTAGDALTFLISWECMSILCYLLVNYEQKQQADSVAGYIMLAMSEAGFLAVVIAFLIVGSGASGLSFVALRAAAAHLSGAAAWGVFLLGFLGFGVKAGLVPVNFWLPRCYTASPPAFIPVLAGVTLNLGILRNPAIERRPGSRSGHRTGSDRPGCGEHHCVSRHSLRHHRERSENDAGPQLNRKCRDHRGGFRSLPGFPEFRQCRPCGHCSDRGALSPGQSFRLQGSPLSGRKPHRSRNWHARHGPAGRLDPLPARFVRRFPRGLPCDLRGSTLQRIRQRMADSANVPAQRPASIRAGQDRVRAFRGDSGIDRGVGRHLLCEGLCDEFPGNPPWELETERGADWRASLASL